MTNTFPVQIGFVLDETPVWLGPMLVFFGLKILLTEFVGQHILTTRRYSLIEVRLGSYSFMLGTLFATAGFTQSQGVTGLFILVLFVAGKVVEGAAAIQLLIKIKNIATAPAAGNQSLVVSVKEKIISVLRYRVSLALVSIAFYSLVILSLVYGPVKQNLLTDLALYWTIALFTTTILGLSYKLNYAQEELGSVVILGLFLCVSGSEVYNYGIVNQILTVVIGSVGHLIGLLLALFFYSFD